MIVRRCRVAPAWKARDLGSILLLRAAWRDHGVVRTTVLREARQRREVEMWGAAHGDPAMTFPGSKLPW